MKMEKTKKFDQCLKNLLTVSGMGRDELARAVGVSVPVVNRWLNGASAPDVYQFRAIANYFGMPYGWFLDGDDDFPGAEEVPRSWACPRIRWKPCGSWPVLGKRGCWRRWTTPSTPSLALPAPHMARCCLSRSSSPILRRRPLPCAGRAGDGSGRGPETGGRVPFPRGEIGRASCRERV